MRKVTVEDLQIGMQIYDRQARLFESYHHPLIITSINKDSVIIWDAGHFPSGKQFTVNIDELSFDKPYSTEIIIY